MADKKITRRDFLHDSTERAFGYLCMPSLATLLVNGRALASTNCPDASASDAPAFIAVDLKGGASIAGNNVIVYDQGGELLSDYQGLGLPNEISPSCPNNSDMIDTTLGMPMHKNSDMLRGIKQTAGNPQDVLAKTNGVVICTKSADDTNKNELASAPGVFLAGSSGLITPLVGRDGGGTGTSGGNSITPFNTTVAPVVITDIASANQIIALSKIWEQQPQRMQKVLAAINKMSFSQLDKFGQLGMPEQTVEMIKCGYLKAKDLLTPGEIDLDPRKDNLVTKATVDNFFRAIATPSPDKNSLNEKMAGEAALEIAYLVLKGYAGSGTISLPDYDYHNGTASLGAQKDFEAGQVIGMILQMAAKLQRKVMIHVYTDGGVDPVITKVGDTCPKSETEKKHNANNVQKFVWSGDSEVRSAAFVLVYDPNGRPTLNFSDSEKQQLGAYKSDDNGTINLSPSKHAAISGSPRAQAQVVVANWLAWQGQEQKIFTAMPDAPINSSELDDYLFMSSS